MLENSLEKRDGNNAVKMVLIGGFSVEKAATTLSCDRESPRRWVGSYRNQILP